MTESRSVFAGTWGLGGHELQIGIRELSAGEGGVGNVQYRQSQVCVLSEITT